jgi:hypothetical protein
MRRTGKTASVPATGMTTGAGAAMTYFMVLNSLEILASGSSEPQ